ncbi:hypothetical protein SBV1_1640009 [Verrucomicrobia bacterium]|nr:hypothetical protein SBV1_1640009 [Verrucomicrobiota bacterium]
MGEVTNYDACKWLHATRDGGSSSAIAEDVTGPACLSSGS